MRIALLGTRGIPANYGGFETFTEELSTRLVERGHEVTVYCREKHPEAVHRGVRLQYLPTIRHKYFDTVAHTAISTWHLLWHCYATMLDSVGTPVGTMRSLLGHSAPEITREVYLHAIPEEQRRAVCNVEKLIFGPKWTQVSTSAVSLEGRSDD